MKVRQFVLTCKESKEYRDTGKTVHAYGGIGYTIEMSDTGAPVVTGLELLDKNAVEFEIIVRR